jgi:hypothetical protein
MGEAKRHLFEPATLAGTACSQHVGVVMAAHGLDYQVAIGKECFRAKVAFSCLVRPEPGDTIIASVSSDSVFITAILERTSATMVIEAPGDLLLTAPRGELHVSAATRLRLHGSAMVETSGAAGSEYFEEKKVTADSLQMSAGALEVTAASSTLVSKHAISTSEDLHVHTRQSLRTVENAEIVKAGTSIQEYQSLLRMHSKTASITTEEDIKIDGRLIHMG